MADGDYERRTAREAELKRLARILREARTARGGESSVPEPRRCGIICGDTGDKR